MENALGPRLGLRGVVVRENSEGVSLRLRLKAWEGASWPRSVQREESSRRRNNVRERSSGKDLGVSEALNGGRRAGTRRAGGRTSREGKRRREGRAGRAGLCRPPSGPRAF